MQVLNNLLQIYACLLALVVNCDSGNSLSHSAYLSSLSLSLITSFLPMSIYFCDSRLNGSHSTLSNLSVGRGIGFLEEKCSSYRLRQSKSCTNSPGSGEVGPHCGQFVHHLWFGISSFEFGEQRGNVPQVNQVVVMHNTCRKNY